jgi:hypothetical protein
MPKGLFPSYRFLVLNFYASFAEKNYIKFRLPHALAILDTNINHYINKSGELALKFRYTYNRSVPNKNIIRLHIIKGKLCMGW